MLKRNVTWEQFVGMPIGKFKKDIIPRFYK